MEKGIRQGCPLSPTLFNLMTTDMEVEMGKREKVEGVKLMGERVYSLAYVDDIVLLAEEEQGVKCLIGKAEDYLQRKKLVVNVEKTKVMRFGKGGGRRKDRMEVEMGKGEKK